MLIFVYFPFFFNKCLFPYLIVSSTGQLLQGSGAGVGQILTGPQLLQAMAAVGGIPALNLQQPLQPNVSLCPAWKNEMKLIL